MLIPIAIVIVGIAVVLWWVIAARRRAVNDGASGNAVMKLRRLVLTREFLKSDATRGGAAAAGGAPRAVVMDWGLEGGTATLVAYDDDTTSLYFSSGGGVIGGGAHETVRLAARVFRDAAQAVRSAFEPVAADDALLFPPNDHATFYLVTNDATLRAGPIETSLLAAAAHPLAALGTHAQQVITAVRESSPGPP
jgi:hypothetical protein